MAEPITRSESFTMNGSEAFIATAYPIYYKPISFKIDGVETTLKTLYVDPIVADQWYWNYQATTVFQGGVIPPANGTIITITYQTQNSNYVATTVPDSITDIQNINDPGIVVDPNPLDDTYNYTPIGGSGIIQSVIDSPWTSTLEQAESVGAGATRKLSVIPLSVKFMSLKPGLKRGQNLSIEWPKYALTGTYIVTEATYKAREVEMGHGSIFERQITAVIMQDAPDQEPADASGITHATSPRYPVYQTTPYQNLQQAAQIRPAPYQFEKLSIVLGSGGSLVAGNPLGNPYIVQHTGTLWSFQIKAAATGAPVNQTLVVDVIQNEAASIFGTLKLEIPSGSTSLITLARFRGYPLATRVNRGDILTFSASYRTGSGAQTPASDVTVIGEWYF